MVTRLLLRMVDILLQIEIEIRNDEILWEVSKKHSRQMVLTSDREKVVS